MLNKREPQVDGQAPPAGEYLSMDPESGIVEMRVRDGDYEQSREAETVGTASEVTSDGCESPGQAGGSEHELSGVSAILDSMLEGESSPAHALGISQSMR